MTLYCKAAEVLQSCEIETKSGLPTRPSDRSDVQLLKSCLTRRTLPVTSEWKYTQRITSIQQRQANNSHSFNLNRSIFNLVTLQQLSQKVRFPYKTWPVMVQVFL